jgi:hypothetical protein
MIDPNKHRFYDRFLAPYPLFVGMIASFLACSAAGISVGRTNSYVNFERFHRYLNGETWFYPTASQVRALGKSRLDPDKTVVVVGGNSILYGTSQRPDYVWTKRLQALLGDQYQVINFAAPGANFVDFGGTAAEILLADYPKLILLTDPRPACPCPEPDGYSYQYFFWDAHYKGLLIADPARTAHLASLGLARTGVADTREMKTQMQLDACFYFRDLWTTVAYRRVSMVWTPLVRSRFFRRRKSWGDPEEEPAPPTALQYSADYRQKNLAEASEWIRVGGLRLAEPRPDGSPGAFAGHLGKGAKLAFPEPLRGRTLCALIHVNPSHRGELESPQLAIYHELFPVTAAALEQAGFAAVEIGKDYPVEAFDDMMHLSEAGGARLAEDLAPRIREMAGRLGYVP